MLSRPKRSKIEVVAPKKKIFQYFLFQLCFYDLVLAYRLHSFSYATSLYIQIYVFPVAFLNIYIIYLIEYPFPQKLTGHLPLSKTLLIHLKLPNPCLYPYNPTSTYLV